MPRHALDGRGRPTSQDVVQDGVFHSVLVSLRAALVGKLPIYLKRIHKSSLHNFKIQFDAPGLVAAAIVHRPKIVAQPPLVQGAGEPFFDVAGLVTLDLADETFVTRRLGPESVRPTNFSGSRPSQLELKKPFGHDCGRS